MLLANNTIKNRMLYIGGKYVSLPARGVVTVDDAAGKAFLSTDVAKQLLDAKILSTGTAPDAAITEVSKATAPKELLAESSNPKVSTEKPSKTGETVKV